MKISSYFGWSFKQIRKSVVAVFLVINISGKMSLFGKQSGEQQIFQG